MKRASPSELTGHMIGVANTAIWIVVAMSCATSRKRVERTATTIPTQIWLTNTRMSPGRTSRLIEET